MGLNTLPWGVRNLGALLANVFSSRRNLYDVFGYTINPSFQQCMAKYVRQDIAGRVVDAPANALWTNPPVITSNNADWDQTWRDFIIQLRLWERLNRADKLAGIGKYSIILIGFNDGQTLDKPVNASRVAAQQKKVLYLQPYSSESAKISKYVNNTASEHFMKPEIYTIDPKHDIDILGQHKQISGIPAIGMAPFTVHRSRVLHICENPMENEVFGAPRMERVFNVLDDLLKVTGGAAETFWLTANRGLHIDIDKDLSMDPADEDALADEIDEYSNNQRRIIRTRGTKVSSLGSDVVDPRGAHSILLATLSSATGIPQRILTGAEAGQLASEQDRANWADRVDERRSDFAMPRVLLPLMGLLTLGGALEAPDDLTVSVLWPHAFKLNPLEAAQTSAQHARSATNFASTFDKLEKLKRGEPGTAPTTSPDGTVIPGTPAIEGADYTGFVSVEEARIFIGLDKPENTIDGAADIMDPTSYQGLSAGSRSGSGMKSMISKGLPFAFRFACLVSPRSVR